MKLSGNRRITAGFVIGLALVILFSLAGFRTGAQYSQTVNDIVHSNATQASIFELQTELDEAETGQRGYVITGNATFLQPYQAAINSINATLSQLQGLVVGDANLTSGYQQLQPLIQDELSELKQVVSVRQAQGFAAAEAIVNTGLGNEYTQEMRAVFSEMNAHIFATQDQEVSMASQQGALRTDYSFIVIVFASGLIVLGAYALNLNLSREQAARVDAERSKRRAELMQDILTHDIRNYDQVSRANAELLRDRLEDEKLRQLADSILAAIDGSSELIRRTRTLGGVLSEKDAPLEAVDLGDSFERALSLVKAAFPDRTIELSSHVGDAKVVADQLLDQVFVNILSNAVKYTNGTLVQLEAKLEAEALGSGDGVKKGRYWKVTIADHGVGMPDEMKKNAFMRYSGAGKGRGLGLSIVRALVVDRYHGKVELRDRVEGDYSLGVKLVVWLPAA